MTEQSSEIRFILDVHLGRLAKYLRLCGFDTLFSTLYEDREIIETSMMEERIILTRDKLLLKDKRVKRGYLIRSQYYREQLKEVFERFNLKEHVRLFTRCITCNTLLETVSKEEISDRLLADTSRYYMEFKRCPTCDRIYWAGSHYDNMKKSLKSLL
ncbi:MAG: Mut7-C RNAse domain-containing protein [Bacteroidales bacterium]|nr:Mut7-C RNAse domain-containing protein [Bacteroidales bacterium]HOO67334.1 Mut7-C RNAse domain-containing protein [Bacteroidales bacterium]HPE23273.1 Mut7-C RNAse domain-containing protein [Bacteroidales bacterium]HPJ05988.1 Mut7-C RNAse domain-containing protein [Bacteroidales bacterium]HRW27743.1 Mut7-C RNAse domain-containing protein [Bacteroidales bacterium]